MGFFQSFERRFGRFAISGLVRVIAGFQFLVWCLLWFNHSFLNYLLLDPGRIAQGQVWRIFSFTFIPSWSNVVTYPPSALTLIAIYFLWFIGEGLEQAWGAFRLNAYVFGSALCCVLAASVLGLHPVLASNFASSVFFSSLLFAFACIYPDLEIRLMLVIPIKMKWVAFIDAGFLFLGVIQDRTFTFALFVAIGLLNFFVVYVPQFIAYMKLRSTVAARRSRFEAQSISDEDPLHRCDVCGITDVEYPDMEFRVTSDGRDICEKCRTAEAENGEP